MKKILIWLTNIIFVFFLFLFISKKLNIDFQFNKKMISYLYMFFIIIPVIATIPIYKKIFKEQKEINEKYIKYRDEFSEEEKIKNNKKIGYIELKKLYWALLFVVVLFGLVLLIK